MANEISKIFNDLGFDNEVTKNDELIELVFDINFVTDDMVRYLIYKLKSSDKKLNGSFMRDFLSNELIYRCTKSKAKEDFELICGVE